MVNAFTGGVEKPIIVLHSALIERLNDEETLAVIAHEVGHIHAEHVLYLTAARLMEALANVSVATLDPGLRDHKIHRLRRHLAAPCLHGRAGPNFRATVPPCSSRRTRTSSAGR